MDLQQEQLDQLGRLFKSSKATSQAITEISGENKTTVTLIALGVTLAITGILRAINK